MAVQFCVIVEVYIAGNWVDLSEDLVAEDGLTIRNGNWQNGPEDRVAQTGNCQFSLRNDDRNDARLAGFYTPGHTNCLTGFTRGLLLRVSFDADQLVAPVVKFYGRLYQILPTPGTAGLRRTACTAFDLFDDLAEHDVRQVGLQLNKTADELLDVIIDSLPIEQQPPARDFEVGLSTFPVAFDDLNGGVRAITLSADLMRSELGHLSQRGDGTLRMEAMHTRALADVAYTFFAGTLTAVRVPGTLDGVYNLVRTTIHPKQPGAAAEVLYDQAVDDVVEFSAGETKVIWSDYFDPNNPQSSIGGTDFENPLLAATDYVANSAADGLGVDVTANFTVTVDPFSSTCKFTITNGGASTSYLTKRQLRGIAIRDQNPATYEASSTQDYGKRKIDIDLKYQSDPVVAQGISDYMEAQFSPVVRRVDQVSFLGNENEEFFEQAMLRECGDRVDVNEEQTALEDVGVFIQGFELRVTPDGTLEVTWPVVIAVGVDLWQLDDPIASILDESTVWGWL